MNGGYFPTPREYTIGYGLTRDRLKLLSPEAVIAHPGPMNRGLEITADAADEARSLILDQVSAGVAVRMSVLYHLLGGSGVSDEVTAAAYLLQGADVLGAGRSDLLLQDGVVRRAVPAGEVPRGAHRIDADGLVALPGLVDLHTHLREPGREDAETIQTGSAAAAGGFHRSARDGQHRSGHRHRRGRRAGPRAGPGQAGLVDVQPVGAVTKSLAGEQLAELGLMARSRARVRVFSDDGKCVHDARLMRRAWSTCARSVGWSPSTRRIRGSPERRRARTRGSCPGGWGCRVGRGSPRRSSSRAT